MLTRAVAALTLLAAGLGVAVFGAVSLFAEPTLPKWLLFAAIVMAVVMRPRAAK
jgi:hypothetical protein